MNMGLSVSNENQTNTVWVNNEPVKFIEPNGYGVVPLKLVFKKGTNKVYVTSKNESEEEGFTNVTIKEGTWDKPDDIITHFNWETKKKNDKSSLFTYQMETGYRSDLSGFDNVTLTTEDEIRKVINDVYHNVKKSLEKKTLTGTGISEAKMDLLMKSAFKVDNYNDAVFNSKSYSVQTPSKPEELEYIIGTKTIFVYNPNGENILKAGPEQTHDGKMVYSFMLESMSLVKSNNTWKLSF